MNDKKSTPLFTAASIFILGWLILYAAQYFARYRFHLSVILHSVPEAIAYLVPLLIPFGMLIRNRKLCFAGCCLSIVFVVIRLFTTNYGMDTWDLISRAYNDGSWETIFQTLTYRQIDLVLLFVLFAIGCFTNRKISAILSWICAVFMVYSFIGQVTSFRFNLSRLSIFFSAWGGVFNSVWKSNSVFYMYLRDAFLFTSYLFGAIGCVLCGLSIAKLPEHVASTSTATIPVQNTASSKIDKIVKLKALLDQGIISQEDFDKKKQEIINS